MHWCIAVNRQPRNAYRDFCISCFAVAHPYAKGNVFLQSGTLDASGLLQKVNLVSSDVTTVPSCKKLSMKLGLEYMLESTNVTGFILIKALQGYVSIPRFIGIALEVYDL